MKIIKVYQERKIDVSAERLWEIVGHGFANLGDWSSLVDKSIGSGKSDIPGAVCEARVCELNSDKIDKVSEKLDYYKDEEKTLSYYVEGGLPKAIKLARNHWQVISLGENQSKLKMTVTIEMDNLIGFLFSWLVKKQFGKSLPTIFDDLKVFAETGKISKQKAKRVKEMQAK